MSQRIIIVGGGIVGLATAYQLRQSHPEATITILEKELEPALHQTGRNSGVIHSGIYYKPGSAKALNCRAGRAELLEFCQTHAIPHQLCGKVIVACSPEELPRLDELHRRGQANGVDCRRIDPAELAEIEPHAQGIAALWVADAGIIDYRAVCSALRAGFEGDLHCHTEVVTIRSGSSIVLETSSGTFEADWLINCAGLQSDRVCKLSGARPGLKIVPFKGEYYCLKPQAVHLCKTLIYPVPDPAFPFLGVHLTTMIGGGVEVGPNAVLALGREAYEKTDLNLADLAETLTYPGFLRLAAKHWRMGLGEVHRSLSKAAFVKALNRLCPALTEADLVAAPCGIRAQAVKADGSLEDDFNILRQGKIINVLNAPSPAATASLAIGKSIAALLD